MSKSETASTTPAKERHHEDLISIQVPPLTAPSTTTSAPHPSEVGGQMRHVQRITNDRRRDHLLAPSRQLAMHGIVRKLDVPRRNWLVCYMSVRHLREPECSSNYQAAGSICQARQAYQLMHNTQGAARSAPHVDTHVHVHGGAPVEICGNPAPRSSLAACQLPICPERRVSLPFTDEGRLHANLERPDSASRFVRLVEQYVVSLGRSSGPVRVSTLVAGRRCPCCLCHTTCANSRTHSYQDPMPR